MSSVHNYYEKLVFDFLKRTCRESGLRLNADLFEDASCLALNRLPPRYVRFDVDTTFYLSPDELHDIEKRVKKAVHQAIEIILAEK